ncbi:MAG: hypothetical protein ACREB8_08645 [Pseudolabrys sp.]
MPITNEAGLSWGRRLLPPIAAAAVAALALVFIGEQFERGAERRALTLRYAELTTQALAPGSTLACLDGAIGETVENACEKAVFASPQSTASAVAYTAARLTLLADTVALSRQRDSDFRETMAPLRRAIELDRFGIAAHVLAVRDSCTADRCAAFALLNDANVIKSNLKAQVFDQYVSRYAGSWEKSEPVAEKPPPAPAPAPVVSLPNPPANKPMSSKYSFPSAASIPAISIMNSEPPRPKAGTEALAAQPAPPAGDHVPVPPKRPQPQAASPPVH